MPVTNRASSLESHMVVRGRGRTCRRYATERFTWDRTAARLESLYDDLLSDGATSRGVDRTAPEDGPASIVPVPP
jgi:hypothetical protein